MTEHDKILLSVIKAGVSAVPIVGGPISVLIGDYVQDETDKSIALSIRHLERIFHQLKGRIDAEAVNRAEFSDLFKSAYFVIMRSHREQKLRAACNVIANALLVEGDSEKLRFEDLDFFVRLIDRLSYAALSMLTLLHSRSGPPHCVTLEGLKSQIPTSPEALPEAALAELHSAGLVEQYRASTAKPDGSIFSFKLSALGVRFIRQVVDWSADDAPVK